MYTEQQLQRKWYTETADDYDRWHLEGDVEHNVALSYIAGLCKLWRASSVLDVGCGTGRAVKFLNSNTIDTIGIEPVRALLDRAVQNNGIRSSLLTCGTADNLPFTDGSFDAVCAIGIMHHVKEQRAAIEEMKRVARRAIFISDHNRFGRGRMASRGAKLLLYKLGLWPLVNRVITRGNGYSILEFDGIVYSYSIYDSLDALSEWAQRIILIPTLAGGGRGWFHPLLTSSHVLLCAVRDEAF